VALYTNDSKDRVRDAVDFLELVSTRTELRRAGPARYTGLCPFHEERSPSFGIDPGQKVYYCFGCQASGDVFTFVQETEGVDFKGALELLAERYNVELQLEAEDPKSEQLRKRRERLLELLRRTADYYERYLWESEEAANAREYLLGRGLSEQILRDFKVGYSPSAWDRVLNASRRGGFQNREVYDAGLAQRAKESGQIYDRFRARIMFPLCNIRGQVLGFGARAMGDERGPKYLNTSDNELYHKGQQLYGAHLARAHATKANEVVLCEGYTDVIALHQAEMKNAVGLMGTALTAEQMNALSAMAHTVQLALDSDTAGQEAMLKAAGLARKRDTRLRVVPMPEGRDPAELIAAEGAEAMRGALARAVPFERFRVERVLANGARTSSEGREAMIGELRPLFAELGDGPVRMELLELVSSRLAEKEGVVEQLLAGKAGRAAPAGGAARMAARSRIVASGERMRSRPEETERAFLALCIASPEQGEVLLGAVDIDAYFSSDLLRRAARHLAAGSLREPLARREGEDLDFDQPLKAMLAELIVEAGSEHANPDKLEAQRLQLELEHIDRQIQMARGGADGDVSRLALRKAEIKQEFDLAYGRVLAESGERA
jgi:DNA primase